MKTGEAFSDPSAATTQMREDAGAHPSPRVLGHGSLDSCSCCHFRAWQICFTEMFGSIFICAIHWLYLPRQVLVLLTVTWFCLPPVIEMMSCLTFSQSCILMVVYLNAQSCRNKTFELNDIVTNHNIDMMLLTETRLKEQGDEALKAEMTLARYVLRHFLRKIDVEVVLPFSWKNKQKNKKTKKHQDVLRRVPRFSSLVRW